MIVHACAPTSLLDFGTWTDTAFAEHGAVLGIASMFYARISLAPRMDERFILRTAPAGSDEIDVFFRAACHYFTLRGIEARVAVDLPPDCGVDFFPASAVALTGALASLAERPVSSHQAALIAHGLWAGESTLSRGLQPFLTAAHGGAVAHDITPFPRAFAERIPLDAELCAAFEEQLLAVVLGPVSGAEVYRRVEVRCIHGDAQGREALWQLRSYPRRAADALQAGDLAMLGTVAQEQGQLLRRLCPRIMTPEVLHLETLARRHNAQAVAINGLGNRVVFFCPEGKRPLEERLTQAGYSVIGSDIDQFGLRIWRYETGEVEHPQRAAHFARAA